MLAAGLAAGFGATGRMGCEPMCPAPGARMTRTEGQPQGAALSKSSFKLELVARLGSGATEHTRRQLKDSCARIQMEKRRRGISFLTFRTFRFLLRKATSMGNFTPKVCMASQGTIQRP